MPKNCISTSLKSSRSLLDRSVPMSNVSVCVRFRPWNSRKSLQASSAASVRRFDKECVTFKDEEDQEEISFTFDRIFYEDSIQADICDIVALPIYDLEKENKSLQMEFST